jgi:hypothetical protein
MRYHPLAEPARVNCLIKGAKISRVDIVLCKLSMESSSYGSGKDKVAVMKTKRWHVIVRYISYCLLALISLMDSTTVLVGHISADIIQPQQGKQRLHMSKIVSQNTHPLK